MFSADNWIPLALANGQQASKKQHQRHLLVQMTDKTLNGTCVG